MWTYDQRSGALTGHGRSFACYSGHGEARNNPDMEGDVGLGPIPRGRWRMTAIEDHPASTGPKTIILVPVGHDALGRSAFRIHGDNAAHDASHGCIVHSPGPDRQAVWDSGDHDLEVV
jgi:hypothetical protein